MTKKQQAGKPPRKPSKPAPKKAAIPAAAPATAVAPPDKLTPEEQMERFAKELKNEDWGHQPC
ncbi:MAG: hypothetical protein PSU94_16310 [Lacunisphaera sp.]|nr:hypothetical protein [Lacunisphaera sp.]